MKVGQVLTPAEVKKINPTFFAACEGDTFYDNTDAASIKRGSMVVLNKSSYREKPVYVAVKVTSAKYAGNDECEVIRVTDGEYSWRVTSVSFCVVP